MLEITILSLPLVIVLFSIALFPIFAPNFWRKNEVTIFSIISLFSVCSTYALTLDASGIIKNALIDEYLPFIITLFTLYTLTHGINIELKSPSNTISNIIFLALCSSFSSIIGTTGASMLFLRPFLDMNKNRHRKAHLVIFFIFLVSNIGGLLTPLGDPPLLLGYLHGVDFSWELKNIFLYWCTYIMSCLAIFYFVDKVSLRKEKLEHRLIDRKFSIKISGSLNIVMIALTVLTLFIDFEDICFPFCEACLIPNVWLKDIILLIFCAISLCYSRRCGAKMDFVPFGEVAKTFFVIFIVIAPVLFILSKNSEAIHGYMTHANRGNDGAIMYFWLCALASSFLDNAPSYLLFFNMAGGNAEELMHVYPSILSAISISSVVMGSMSYIGNAPNMMVKSIAERGGIKMPHFIGYMLWACLIIFPISIVVSFML
ncbi:MAG: sodium:proton antiporter [Holosporales bacterium]|nr:sodium:proton antiporter [Holosporales bacterium]